MTRVRKWLEGLFKKPKAASNKRIDKVSKTLEITKNILGALYYVYSFVKDVLE